MNALRAARGACHLTQEQLAEKSGISVEQIRNIERGRTLNPHAPTLEKLAAVLGVSPSTLQVPESRESEAAA